MHTRTMFLMAALVAALALTIGAEAATALRSLSISGRQTLTLTGRITFEAESGSSNGEIICPVTLVKTISRAIPKVEGILIGKVTDFRFGAHETCTVGGTANEVNSITPLGVEREELWRLFYEEFLGTLPRITGLLVTLRNVQILLDVRSFGAELRCLYANARRPESLGLLARIENGLIGRLNTLNELGQVSTRELSLVRALGTFCPGVVRVKLELTPLQETRVTLV